MLSRLIWQRKGIDIFFYQFWSEIERLRSPAFILLSWGFTPKTGIWKLPLSSNLKKEKGNEYWLFLNQLLSNFGVNNSPSSCVQLLDRNKADIFISWCDNFFGPEIQNNTKYFEKLTGYSTYKNFHLFMFFSSFFSNIPLSKNKL